jgi:cation diffusion facilitator family transporter
MAELDTPLFEPTHQHVFLGEGHARAERQTWAVIWLCGAMMALEIAGGMLFGSLALVADGLHMSTHASALLLAALAYRYARRHAGDRRFAFGTGKLGDLAGFTSAVILAMIALLIAYEAISRFLNPIPIQFREAIPIAVLGLGVNLLSAWLLSRGSHPHHHHHDHDEHDHHRDHGRGPHQAAAGHEHGHHDGVALAAAHRDNNLRAAIIHVAADAAVSVLVIVGLLLARTFGWLWMDPLAGIVGACVIATWSLGLVRDTGRVLLDMTPDRGLEARIQKSVQIAGDRLTDLHLWRLGPGHLGAILAIETSQPRDASFYREKLGSIAPLSHVTIEIQRVA